MTSLLCWLSPAAAANYGYWPYHTCPRCRRVSVDICAFSGRWHWHRCGPNYWYHETH